MSAVIRLAQDADVPGLAQLRRQSRESADDPEFEARFAAWVEAEGERRTTWVAEDGGVIGCASLFEYRRMPAPDRADSSWGYLGNMMVVEERRDAGSDAGGHRLMVRAGQPHGQVPGAPEPH